MASFSALHWQMPRIFFGRATSDFGEKTHSKMHGFANQTADWRANPRIGEPIREFANQTTANREVNAAIRKARAAFADAMRDSEV